MTRRYRLSRRARADLTEIGRYTARVWGKAKRDAYLAALYRRIAWLAEDPLRGRLRSEIAANIYSYPQGTHLVFFMVKFDQTIIIGIPHQAMDLHAHFEGDDLE